MIRGSGVDLSQFREWPEPEGPPVVVRAARKGSTIRSGAASASARIKFASITGARAEMSAASSARIRQYR